MNFLAHLYLSEDNIDSIVGNFIADHVKGSSIDNYSNEIKSAIRFHRSIDQYTDNHAVVQETLVHLRPEFRKYSGVVLDMYYDHFLAANWNNWSDEKLDDFTRRMFKTLNSRISSLPQRSQYILPYMIAENWLLNYRNFEGLNRALSGISSRTKFYSNLENATKHLKKNYQVYENSFNQFFPDLIRFSKSGALQL